MNNPTTMGRIPTFHIVANSIPQAWFRAMHAVWDGGIEIRTEYDLKENGKYIDPPSRDARVLIEITDPFTDPRFPVVSQSEIGAYMAEILGVKDHLVLPMETLKTAIHGELEAHQWPYTYHERATAHPDINGETVDQLALAIDRVAKTPYTRRAMITTAVPNLDPFMQDDNPCLREIQLRCAVNENGVWMLNATLFWRSRDLYKAWHDNTLAITYWLKLIAEEISCRAGVEVRLGSYAEFSASLHIYGQDHVYVGGDKSREGFKSFFDNFPDEEAFLKRCLTEKFANNNLVIPQLQDLLAPAKIKEWRFGPDQIKIIKNLIANLESAT